MLTTSPVAMTSARAIVAGCAMSIALTASTTLAGGTPSVLHEAQKLIASDGMPSDKFGFAIDRDGDTLVIGAPQHYTNSLPGSFYVFTRDPAGQWTEQQRVMSDFQPGEAEFGDLFGSAVALQGDTLLVGAPFVESGGVMTVGSVYVFTRDATGDWTSQQTIAPVDQSVQSFGEHIALAGDVAVISSFDRAFVFERDGAGMWSQQAELPGLELDFVGPVAFDGQRIVVADGAFSPNDHRAHVFSDDGSGWALASTIIAPPTFLGRIADVSLDGDRLALGLPDAAGPDRAFVYQSVEAKSWSQEATLDPNSLDNDSFGMDVKLEGSLLLAGANHAGANGIAYLFQRDDAGGWAEHAQLTPSDTFAHNFGDEIDFDDHLPVIGSWAHHENGLYSGAVYVFAPIAGPTPNAADVTGDGTVDVDDLVAVILAWGECADPNNCPSDIDGDDVVEVDDLIAVILNWG
jgi:hypothetical protein